MEFLEYHQRGGDHAVCRCCGQSAHSSHHRRSFAPCGGSLLHGKPPTEAEYCLCADTSLLLALPPTTYLSNYQAPFAQAQAVRRQSAPTLRSATVYTEPLCLTC